jgi:hypothetical protein
MLINRLRTKTASIATAWGLGAFLCCAVSASAVPVVNVTLNVDPLPARLNLAGPAIAPESQLLSCSADYRKRIQPDLEAISKLVLLAGGKRTLPRDFSAGKPITTPDGLIFAILATSNESYAVTIDSSHLGAATSTTVFPEQYFDVCVRMSAGSSAQMTSLGLPYPKINSATAQYSPAIGFYLLTSSAP